MGPVERACVKHVISTWGETYDIIGHACHGRTAGWGIKGMHPQQYLLAALRCRATQIMHRTFFSLLCTSWPEPACLLMRPGLHHWVDNGCLVFQGCSAAKPGANVEFAFPRIRCRQRCHASLTKMWGGINLVMAWLPWQWEAGCL